MGSSRFRRLELRSAFGTPPKGDVDATIYAKEAPCLALLHEPFS
jgi:hypothetical protein